MIVELLEHKSIFTAGYTAILHVNALAEECSILQLTSQVPPPPFLFPMATRRSPPRSAPPRPQIDKKTGKKSKKPPMFCKGGAVITCIIETEQVVCVEPFDVCPQLGRFTLRDEGKTIGIGKILDLSPDAQRGDESEQPA